MNRLLTAASGFILLFIIGYLLIVGRGIIVPFVIAIFIWNILNTVHHGIYKLPKVGSHLPSWLCRVLSFVIVSAAVMIVINIITENVTDVIAASSRYQENLLRIYNTIDLRYNIKSWMAFDRLTAGINVQYMLISIYGVFTSMMSSAVLITLYVAFLFIEQLYFQDKLNALFQKPESRQVVDSIISHIAKDTQTYLGLKTLLSLGTATASWIIMKVAGLDFAEFWALLIFFLNFVPNIGAIIATAFPALLALIQFQTWIPFVIITSCLVVVQFIMGNIVEPKFLSKSLNLSPLIILLTLALWGAIWGIMGMFLSIPITVMMMIVFAHFESTRPIAIFLSQDGYVKNSYE